jgi:hypothetical protein
MYSELSSLLVQHYSNALLHQQETCATHEGKIAAHEMGTNESGRVWNMDPVRMACFAGPLFQHQTISVSKHEAFKINTMGLVSKVHFQRCEWCLVLASTAAMSFTERAERVARETFCSSQ